MKQIEKLAIPLMILFIVSSVAANMVRSFGGNLAHDFEWSPLTLSLLTVPLTAIVLAVRIFIAFWLFRLAKTESDSPWCWAMFGLIFGLTAVILFYAVNILEALRASRTTSPTAVPDEARGGPIERTQR